MSLTTISPRPRVLRNQYLIHCRMGLCRTLQRLGTWMDPAEDILCGGLWWLPSLPQRQFGRNQVISEAVNRLNCEQCGWSLSVKPQPLLSVQTAELPIGACLGSNMACTELDGYALALLERSDAARLVGDGTQRENH